MQVISAHNFVDIVALSLTLPTSISCNYSVVLSGFETIKAALAETEDFLDRFDVEWMLDHGTRKGISGADYRIIKRKMKTIKISGRSIQ